MQCLCPVPTTLVTLPIDPCPENLGQIQKHVYVRKAGAVSFADSTAFGTLANWTPLISAVDDTLIMTSMFFEAYTIPPATAITRGGGDNETLDGIAKVTGVSNITATGRYANPTAAYIKALKNFICEDLGVFMINEWGQLIGENLTGTVVTPIPIYTFFVANAGAEGKNTDNFAPFQHDFVEGWRDDLVIVDPVDFNAKTDLHP